MKILLMEDDRVLGETVQELLENEGYRVDLASDGDEAAELSFNERYDLYVFDINVPRINGFELLEQLRSADDKTPVIYISALVDLNSITKGFELGADDYLKKPFFPEELLLRVKAKFSSLQNQVVCGEIRYNPQSRDVYKNGEFLSLSEIQMALLELFIRNIGRTIDKTLLFDCLENPTDTALRVHINKLKQSTLLPIKNIRGVGYRLEAC